MPTQKILLYIIPAYVLFTFIAALLIISTKKVNNRILLLILSVSIGTEILAAFLKNIGLLYSISFIIHHGLWLLLLTRNIMVKKILIAFITVFLTICIINLFYFEGIYEPNNYTFVFGAFLYIVIFIFESFYQLKKENFPFFLSNDYLLLFAPVIFFFGFSFTFAFKIDILPYVFIIGNIELYYFIGFIVNLIYYSLINLYIFKEKRQNGAKSG